MISTDFESSVANVADLVKHISRLIDGNSAQIRSTHDISEKTYQISIKVPLTRKNSDAVKALTELGVQAARA